MKFHLNIFNIYCSKDEGFENENVNEVKPEIFVSESQASTSTSQEKESENEVPQEAVKRRDDNREQEESNQESLLMDSAINGK